MRARVLSLAVIVAFVMSGCSLTAAGDFHECDGNEQCGEGRICVENYCIPNKTPEGCGTVYGVEDADAIPLAAALPLTTDGTTTDESERQGLNAMLLALEEINQNQGVNNRPFLLHFCDTQGDSEKLKAMAGWLIDEKKALAIITSGSAQTIAASTVTVPKNTLLVSATATSPAIAAIQDTNGGSVGLVWRTAPSDAIQGSVIADLLLNDLRFSAVSKVGLIYLNDPYGQGLSGVLNEAFSGQMKTFDSLSYPRGGEVGGVVAQLDALNPDLTILVAFPDDAARILNAATLTTNLSEAAGHRWFLTDSAKDPTLLGNLSSPSQLDTAFGTAPAQGQLVNSPAYAQFKGSFTSKFGVDPNQYSFTSNSYDAIYVIALGTAFAAQGGSGALTGARIADGLTRLSQGAKVNIAPDQFITAKGQLQAGVSIDLVGTSGSLNFDAATGEAPARIEVWKVKLPERTGFATEEVRDPPGG